MSVFDLYEYNADISIYSSNKNDFDVNVGGGVVCTFLLEIISHLNEFLPI